MAHIKTGTTTKGNRDSIGKRLGIKVYGGGKVKSGNIIVRQRGTKINAGNGTKLGNDFTIYAVSSGVVHFKTKFKDKFVEIIPQ